jgi:hypothetical protein
MRERVLLLGRRLSVSMSFSVIGKPASWGKECFDAVLHATEKGCEAHREIVGRYMCT